jgi:hypothetical protein
VSDAVADLDWLSDDATRWVMAPLPEDFDSVDQVVHVENGERRTIQPDWISLHH